MVSRWVNRWPGTKRRNNSGAWGRTLRFRWLAWNGFGFLGRHISLKKEAACEFPLKGEAGSSLGGCRSLRQFLGLSLFPFVPTLEPVHEQLSSWLSSLYDCETLSKFFALCPKVSLTVDVLSKTH
ncbi:hypothetical protein P5673_013732 [Acropora cervicornis]|uniref:Uncharacterized protein n=1 Tax=Acropora cervicornis TaxID=6130 RepID=A0AAD9QK34_ACRCE|nr:hypothetical protein P5673_013732 [Acropora cervicornis]